MRIRSIKPEFWRSDDIDALDWHDRLLFIGLWSYVDDNGVGRDKVANVAADIFAGDLSVDPTETLRRVSLGLETLYRNGQIARYRVGGKGYLHVTAWERHQLVKNPNKQRYPLPTCEDSEPTEILRTSSGDSTETLPTGAGEQGNRGTGEQTLLADTSAIASDPDSLDRFEEFWAIYGYKQKRVDSERAWTKATRKTDPEEIIVGARKYVAKLARDRARRGDRATAQAHASSWLNGERWNDDLDDEPTADIRRLPHARDIEQPPNGLSDEQMAAWMEARA